MTGWNLPPGVTGREYAISGPEWDGEIERTCATKNVTITIVDREDDGNTFVLEVDECPLIDREVYAQRYNGVLSWTCPACGTEHIEDEEGPDD